MLFNSLQFLYFFGVVTSLYFVLPHRWRWLLLLTGSCYFYMAFVPVYILILFGTIVIDYVAGIGIEKLNLLNKRQGAKRLLVLSIVANVGVLAVFKYYNFFLGSLEELFLSLGLRIDWPFLNILLPIGLSFHTFQAMSYTVEVYRGHQQAERHFGIYALYVMFYPQLVAGPIERPQNILHQFYEEKYFDYERVKSGLLLMLVGFFKKIVVADRLAVIADRVFDHPRDYPASSLALAALCFSFQIYCDFSGYTDIAIGSARVMGFKLMKNFNRPYLSRSVTEFWTRWHISLSTWFRDYVYIPLGGNRVRLPRWCFNIMVVFALSGLWHGANWTFIVWGILHGVFLIAERLLKHSGEPLSENHGRHAPSQWKQVLEVLVTFSLITLTWIFFRSAHLADAWYFVTHLFVPDLTVKLPGGLTYIMLSLGFAFVLFLLEWWHSRHDLYAWLQRKSLPVRWVIYYALIAAILCFGEFEKVQFIYFQF